VVQPVWESNNRGRNSVKNEQLESPGKAQGAVVTNTQAAETKKNNENSKREGKEKTKNRPIAHSARAGRNR